MRPARIVQIFASLLYRATSSISWNWAMLLRRPLVSIMLGRRLRGLFIFNNVVLEKFRCLKLGDHVSIHHGCYLVCNGGITIGNYVAIGRGSTIMSTEHSYSDPTIPIKYQAITAAPVVISDNVWIGAHVIILSGVTIASGTVIGAGSIVTKSITTPDTVVAGVPAKFIKHRLKSQYLDREKDVLPA